jgi:hypothetical protein
VTAPRQPYAVRLGAALGAIGLLQIIYFAVGWCDVGYLVIGLVFVVGGAVIVAIGQRRSASAS